MDINDLTFEHVGCCGGAATAKVLHDNGLMTQISRCDDGTYSAVTYAGGAIYKPLAEGLSAPDALHRIADDSTAV